MKLIGVEMQEVPFSSQDPLDNSRLNQSIASMVGSENIQGKIC